jgi:hypothetical protein
MNASLLKYKWVYQQLTQLVLSWGESSVGAIAPTEVGIGLVRSDY